MPFDRDRGVAELVERRWSWPAPGGKPVFNMRSDGREFSQATAAWCWPMASTSSRRRPTRSRSARTAGCFRPPQGDFAIAGLVRNDPDVGEAFTLLTVPPGPDIAPYHNRQIALLDPPHWRAWLDGSAKIVEMLSPSVAGSLAISAQDLSLFHGTALTQPCPQS